MDDRAGRHASSVESPQESRGLVAASMSAMRNPVETENLCAHAEDRNGRREAVDNCRGPK
jgi:hypothetical protein